MDYHYSEPSERRTLIATALGFLLGVLVALILGITWQDAGAIEQTYASPSHTYRITPAEDGSPLITKDGVRMYLTTEPQYAGGK